jgi:transcriptional regulator with XRE-family HTH domain
MASIVCERGPANEGSGVPGPGSTRNVVRPVVILERMADDELAQFLQARRARLRPEDLGLRPSLGPRRVPGLRREELAAAAGVSVDYYVRLEQGRAQNISDAVLDAIARTLRLDDTEREHLGRLVRPVRRVGAASAQQVRPGLRRVLESLDAVPAFVLGRRMDVLAWNRLAGLLMPFDELEPRERNMPRLVFLDPRSRDEYPEWEAVARETVAYLRWDAGRYPDDAELATLVGELSLRSEDFRRYWAEQTVVEKSHGRKLIEHPVAGRLVLGYETFDLPDDPDQTLCIYTAEAGSETESALRFLSSWSQR